MSEHTAENDAALRARIEEAERATTEDFANENLTWQARADRAHYRLRSLLDTGVIPPDRGAS
jgi:hypothetical protein